MTAKAATKATAPAKGLPARAVLASLTISEWRPRRECRPAAAAAAKAFSADPGSAGTYTKNLISHNAIADIRRIRNLARSAHYHLTLPWGDRGERLLPNKVVSRWQSEMQTLRRQFEKAVADLIGGWAAVVAEAKTDLGKLFDQNEYPDPANLKNAYTFAAQIAPLADPADFRVQIDKAAAEKIAADYRAQVESRANAAQGEVIERIRDAVTHAAATLANPEAGFHKTLLGHLAELGALVPDLDLTGDPRLADLAAALADLGGRDVNEVKTNPETRQNAAAAAAEIADRLGSFYAATAPAGEGESDDE